MRRIAGHNQHIRPHFLQPPRALHQLRQRVRPAVEQRGRPVRDVGVAVDDHVQVLLVAGGFCMAHDLLKQVRRGQRAHAADDADCFLFHACFSSSQKLFPIYYIISLLRRQEGGRKPLTVLWEGCYTGEKCVGRDIHSLRPPMWTGSTLRTERTAGKKGRGSGRSLSSPYSPLL